MRELRQVGMHRASGRVCGGRTGALLTAFAPHRRVAAPGVRATPGRLCGGGMALFASDEVEACPVCGKDACVQHRAACGYCGRNVCTADLERQSRRCATCAQLAAIAEPPEAVITAAR